MSRLGEHPRLALLLGDAYRVAGDGDLARGQYEKAIQLGHPYPDARVALARLYRGQGNIPGALVELTQAIDEYGTGGAGGTAAAYVEMAEAERARERQARQAQGPLREGAGEGPRQLRGAVGRRQGRVRAAEGSPTACGAGWTPTSRSARAGARGGGGEIVGGK